MRVRLKFGNFGLISRIIHIIKNGDAHDLDGMVGSTTLEFDEITLANIEKAILEQT
jgi:hypothetical protein